MSRGDIEKATDLANRINNQHFFFTSDLLNEIAHVKKSKEKYIASYRNIIKSYLAGELKQFSVSSHFLLDVDSGLLSGQVLRASMLLADGKKIDSQVTQIISNFPDSCSALRYNSYDFLKSNDVKNAILNTQNILKREPKSLLIKKHLADLYIKDNNIEKAIAILETLFGSNSRISIDAMNDWAYLIVKYHPERIDEAYEQALRAGVII